MWSAGSGLGYDIPQPTEKRFKLALKSLLAQLATVKRQIIAKRIVLDLQKKLEQDYSSEEQEMKALEEKKEALLSALEVLQSTFYKPQQGKVK